MTLTEDYIKQMEEAARAYDNATDAQERAVLGARLDALATPMPMHLRSRSGDR